MNRIMDEAESENSSQDNESQGQGQGASINEVNGESGTTSLALSKFYEAEKTDLTKEDRDRSISYSIDGEYPISNFSQKSMEA